MWTYSGQAAPERRVSDLFVCPRCEEHEFEAVTDGEMVNFLCLGCHMCWHLELGYVHLVDVRNCPGCAHKPHCISRPLRRECAVLQ